VPTQLKIARGTRKRLNHGEPRPKAPEKAPPAPKWLTKDGRDEWKRKAESLRDMGLLTVADLALLAQYCEAYERWREAVRNMRKHGMVDDLRGARVKNGFVSIAEFASRQMQQIGAEFGFSPSSRTRVKVPKSTAKKSGSERYYIEKGA